MFVLLFQALVGSSGLGPVVVSGVLHPAAVSSSCKAPTLISADDNMNLLGKLKASLNQERLRNLINVDSSINLFTDLPLEPAPRSLKKADLDLSLRPPKLL